MQLFFDTETTGLPTKLNGKFRYKDLRSFEGARLVSISWDFRDTVHSFLVKPEGFEIPKEATAIHGITTEHAIANGVPIRDVLERFMGDVECCDLLVAHNISFDKAIIKHEIVRAYSNDAAKRSELLGKLKSIKKFCTMTKACEILGLTRWPRLSNLYSTVCGVDADVNSLHRADYDVFCCKKIFQEFLKINK